MPKDKPRMEFRYYEIPEGEYVLPLLGRGWEQEYGLGYEGVQHFHNHMEIGYCYQGDGHFELADRHEPYEGGCFTIVPKSIPHTTVSAPGHICKWEFLFIDADQFLADLQKADMRNAGMINADQMLRTINRQGYFLREQEHPGLAGLVRTILEICRTQPLFYLESIKGYLYALLIEVLRMEREEEEGQVGQMPARAGSYIRNAVRFMETHFQEEISVADTAAACGLSESHFRRVFQQTMNMKPLDYLNMVRVRNACRLIVKEEIPMHDVAFLSGYTTLSTFNRNFLRLTGMTPNEWKKEKRRNGEALGSFRIRALKGWEGILTDQDPSEAEGTGPTEEK